jgi:hypothetical protein
LGIPAPLGANIVPLAKPKMVWAGETVSSQKNSEMGRAGGKSTVQSD